MLGMGGGKEESDQCVYICSNGGSSLLCDIDKDNNKVI